MRNLPKGILLTIVLSAIVLFFFFGPILKNPNRVYFASGGDGFKSYYGSIYHLQVDSSYLKFEGMNYPYGESVFFTDNQPLLTNSVKWFSNNMIDIRSNMVGIINLSMILSILIAAIFLFLLFAELGTAWWYGALASVGICMLSPQIGRMSGHFSLAYLFWIPLMLYLIVRFSKKESWALSLLISFVGFLAASMQLYFLGFYGFLLIFYWLQARNWFKENMRVRLIALIHLFIQACLPFIFLEIIMILTDPVSDRTTHPYGFLIYLAHPVSVFLPSGAPYAFVPKFITVFKHLDWEALACIGVASLAGFVVGLISFLKKMFTGKAFWRVSDDPVLTAFFWASLLALLLSFGLPFKLGMEWLIDYIGPFRQLRALSRFSWLFFYVINVIVFYQLHRWFAESKGRIVPLSIIFIAFSLLFIDGYYNMKGTASRLHNEMPAMDDVKNELPVNRWVSQIDASQFQAIIPIPYFHVGSENIWIEPKNNSLESTLIASLKTGLPTTAVMMGRTSISQTYRNYSLLMEPLQNYDILKDFRNKKDLLLLVMKGSELNSDEKRIVSASTFLTDNDQFELHRLTCDSLAQIPDQYRHQVIGGFDAGKLMKKNNLVVSDTISFLYCQGYNDEVNAAFDGKGAHTLIGKDWNTLFEQKLFRAKKGDDYLVSFWLKNYKTDGYPRFKIENTQTDESGKVLDSFHSFITSYIKAIDGDWALFEIPVDVKADDVLLKVNVQNTVLRKTNYVIDELLIRNSKNDIFRTEENCLMKNTRRFQLN